MQEEEFIIPRGLAFNGEENQYFVFIGDPHTTISNKKSYVKKLNKSIRVLMRDRIDKYIEKLSFTSRIKARLALRGYWRKKIVNVIKYRGSKAIDPHIPLLDFILKFCIEFNCLEVLRECLEIVDTYIFTDTLNCKLNPDVFYEIMYSKDKSKLYFKWTSSL